MQGTSKVRSGRAKKNKGPQDAKERERDDADEKEATIEASSGDATKPSSEREPPAGPMRSGNFVMVWFLIPLVLVLLYGLFSR